MRRLRLEGWPPTRPNDIAILPRARPLVAILRDAAAERPLLRMRGRDCCAAFAQSTAMRAGHALLLLAGGKDLGDDRPPHLLLLRMNAASSSTDIGFT